MTDMLHREKFEVGPNSAFLATEEDDTDSTLMLTG